MSNKAADELADYVGRRQMQSDDVSLQLCRRLAALLDLDPDLSHRGDELPFSWSLVLFADLPKQNEIGDDGHARRGDFLPAVSLSNRRFAGRSVKIHRALRIGESVKRASTITKVTTKQGRHGELIFVTIEHEVSSERSGPAYTEQQSIVYLAEGSTSANLTEAPLPDASWEETFTPDPVLLFRYSAITFNGHRIHYDAPYATAVEGYPALVVNGGLTTLRLLEFARARLRHTITEYQVRAVRPLYVGRTVVLRGRQLDDKAQFWAVDDENRLAMKIDLMTA